MNHTSVDQIKIIIKDTVEKAVDEKINGKLLGITEHLKKQDKTLERVEELLEDKDFLVKLWAFTKFLGGVLMAIGSGILIYKKLK